MGSSLKRSPFYLRRSRITRRETYWKQDVAVVVGCLGSGARLPWFKSQLHHLCASFGLSFYLCSVFLSVEQDCNRYLPHMGKALSMMLATYQALNICLAVVGASNVKLD